MREKDDLTLYYFQSPITEYEDADDNDDDHGNDDQSFKKFIYLAWKWKGLDID